MILRSGRVCDYVRLTTLTTAASVSSVNLLRHPSRSRSSLPVGALSEAAVVWSMLGMWLGLLGPVSPLMVLSGAAGLAALHPHRLVFVARLWPVLLIGVLAMASALWSAEPGISARYGFQLFLTICAGVVLVVTCSTDRLLRGLFVACFIVLILSILSGRQGQSASGPVLVGLLGSKNDMGTLCLILLAGAVSVAVGTDQPRWLRLLCAPAAALALLFLFKAFSAGAVLGAFIFFGAFVALVTASKLSGSAKFLLALTLVILLAPLLMVREGLADIWRHILVDVLHKDTGLTGRDYLWAHADALIAAEPLLGHGYRSTWLGHGVDTIGLLRWADLQSGEGFSFHNSYREWLVDFGYVGGVLIVVALGVGLLKTIANAASKGVVASVLCFASLGIVFAVRGYFEYVFNPFNSSTMIVILAVGIGYISMVSSGGGRKSMRH